MIKSPSRGGGKRSGKHVQMATHQSTAYPRGQHQKDSPGDFITKPFDAREIRARVATLLTMKKLAEEAVKN